MARTISHSEITSLLNCQALHDFKYVGQLAGAALKPKASRPMLRDGSAWGAGVAAWHQTGDVMTARNALLASLAKDADEQREHGLYMADEHEEARGLLVALLSHYTNTTQRLPLTGLEHRISTPIPSRSGVRRSNQYRLECFFDGIHRDDDGRTWLVEFKLRSTLSSFEQIALSRQLRWYAWAFREETGVDVAGVICDERWKALPKPARLVRGKKKTDPELVASHAKDQLTTPDLYLDACRKTGVDPDPEALEAYRARRWQARHPVVFRPGEIDEAGRQLVSAAKQIRDFDTGELYPIRNPSPRNCGGCQFREICPNPDDMNLVSMLFERRPAKRDAPLEVAA